jgi:dTDP-4-dehydrorhamnose reductase
MILVFGKTGQVAKHLMGSADVQCLGREDADLSNPATCETAILQYQPKGVINAAAYTAVDRAEEEEGLATIINGDAPTRMAQTCAQLGVPFINISTDYVFDGRGAFAWKTTDNTSPQNAYGRSKLAGEFGVQASGSAFVILRTSWVISAHGKNFVKTMLKLSEMRNSLSIVCDQIGAPTPACDIADACLKIISELQVYPEKSGIYHFSGSPNTSWFDFATDIFNYTGRDIKLLPVPTTEFPTPAQRPLNSRLDCDATMREFKLERPDWRAGLKDILKELGALS